MAEDSSSYRVRNRWITQPCRNFDCTKNATEEALHASTSVAGTMGLQPTDIAGSEEGVHRHTALGIWAHNCCKS